MIYYLFRDKITLSHSLTVAIILVVAICSLYRPLIVAVGYASLVYLTLYLAYIPAQALLRSFNKLGDYSYGIYIFGYPTQQAIESTWPNLPFAMYCGLSFVITLLLAVVSWHWIERNAINLKNQKKKENHL